MRDLKKSNSINLGEQREYNHLRISNLDYFHEYFCNNLEYYKSPFKVLSELEEEILYENNPGKIILIPYKESGGDCIFRLDSIEEKGNLRVVTYSYDSTIS